MTLTQRDFRKLLLPLAATLTLLVMAGALAWWSHAEKDGAAQERNRAAEGKTRIETRLRQFHSEESDLKARSQLLQHLQDAGILGEERRLDWMEQLRNTQRDLRLPGLNYEFAVQAPLNRAAASGYTWFNSPLRLQLRLLHEGDLLNALDHLQRQAHAMVIVRSCRLAPPPVKDERRESVAALQADCTLDWLTVRQAVAKK